MRSGVCFFLLIGFHSASVLGRKQTCCRSQQSDAAFWESSCSSCIFLRAVGKISLQTRACVALCSFSSAAHLVGYYVKEMESIAEQWVMLFTGKSDDRRQGITPSRSDVSWKIPLFLWEEGKVQRTLEMVGMSTGTFVRKGRRTQPISELRCSPYQRYSKKCPECNKSI